MHRIERCLFRDCKLVKTDYLSPTRVIMEYKAPLAEIVYDFYDQIKGISHGFATMDYEFTGFEAGDLVKIDTRDDSFVERVTE